MRLYRTLLCLQQYMKFLCIFQSVFVALLLPFAIGYRTNRMPAHRHRAQWIGAAENNGMDSCCHININLTAKIWTTLSIDNSFDLVSLATRRRVEYGIRWRCDVILCVRLCVCVCAVRSSSFTFDDNCVNSLWAERTVWICVSFFHFCAVRSSWSVFCTAFYAFGK